MENINLDSIATEKQNPLTTSIDSLDTEKMLHLINEQDKLVPLAIEKVIPEIAFAVDKITEAIHSGGRLIYIGAGTSGRLGVLDAAECPPTFGISPNTVIGIIAGGYGSMFNAKEGAEDSSSLEVNEVKECLFFKEDILLGAVNDLKECLFSEKDILVGIAASGRTPYVISGLEYAKEIGAFSVALVCSPNSPMSKIASHTICVQPGPEVITGSTRMKAGTCQKLVLNMLSTGAMIKLGKVYGNLMVDVKSSNKKLEERAKHIVMTATGCTYEQAETTLINANGQAKTAILMLLAGLSYQEATTRLKNNDGFIREALRKE